MPPSRGCYVYRLFACSAVGDRCRSGKKLDSARKPSADEVGWNGIGQPERFVAIRAATPRRFQRFVSAGLGLVGCRAGAASRDIGTEM